MSATETNPKYKNLDIGELEYFKRRDIREPVVSELKEGIEERGYDDGRPLKVVSNSDGYLVADGNHRLKAVQKLNLNRKLPCLVYPDGDPVEIGVSSNQSEDVYAQEDLFDSLDTIKYLRDEHTQAEIGEKLGWSRDKVARYNQILEKVVTEVIELARSHQEGRVTTDCDNCHNFTEGWFRNSGLYELDRDEGWFAYAKEDEMFPLHAQYRVMWWFCEEKNCNTSRNQVEKKCEKVLEKLEMLDMIDEDLGGGVAIQKRRELQQAAVSGSHSKKTLPDAIQSANKDAQDRAIFGACATDELPTLDDNSISCVVTDPPYGVDYTSHRDTGRDDFPDGDEETLLLLDDVFQELERVCKENAHLYIFAPWDTGIPELASDYFEVADMPLIWVKNNHVPTRNRENGFDKMYAPKYQMVWVCRMPHGDERSLRPQGEVNSNVFNYARPTETWHDTQKPVPLLKNLITNSTGEGETILDPFAGSGTSLLAAAQTDRHYVGIELNDAYEDKFTREVREVKNDS